MVHLADVLQELRKVVYSLLLLLLTPHAGRNR
jgi:hypothetical protein